MSRFVKFRIDDILKRLPPASDVTAGCVGVFLFYE
jgi:hypothetical protein